VRRPLARSPRHQELLEEATGNQCVGPKADAAHGADVRLANSLDLKTKLKVVVKIDCGPLEQRLRCVFK